MKGTEPPTEAHIPTPIIESIYTILMKALFVGVPYSHDPLQMAQAAIDRQKEAISHVLDILYKHCPLLLDLPEEPEP